jgi:hypothetical protein
MKACKLTTLALALATSFTPLAYADPTQDLLNELQALKARMAELERRLNESQAAQAAAPVAAAPAAAAGMTADEREEFNRIAVKAEANEDAFEAAGLKGMVISGYMDPTYIYNANQHRAGFQFLNPVSDDGYNYDNSYFGSVAIDFQKETQAGTRWRLTLAPNRGVGSVFQGNDSPVHEATISVPISDLQTRFIAGQMPDWSGYEYLQPTLNPLITHNMLFDFTLPTAYTGAGVDITRGKWWIRSMLANMNASKRGASEATPVLAYRVDYSKGEFQGFGFAGVHGKAANFNGTADTSLNLFEVDAYFIRGDWTVQGQLSYGTQKQAAIAPDPVSGDWRDARWWGASALAAYNFTPRLKTIVRADYINNEKNGGGLLGFTGYWDPAGGVLGDDRNGIGVDATLDCLTDPTINECNEGANRSAISLGINYAINLNTVFKAEYRIDTASKAVFLDTDSGTYKKNNSLLGASVVVSF